MMIKARLSDNTLLCVDTENKLLWLEYHKFKHKTRLYDCLVSHRGNDLLVALSHEVEDYGTVNHIYSIDYENMVAKELELKQIFNSIVLLDSL